MERSVNLRSRARNPRGERPDMNILVVEAAAGESSATALFLSAGRPHYAVECATNPTEALSRLDQACFDLVLMDRRLAPGLLSLGPGDTPVVLLDDAVTPETQAEARDLGAIELLPRSAEGMEALFRTVDRLCEIRRIGEGQHLLLKHLHGEGTTGPCSTGGTRPR